MQNTPLRNYVSGELKNFIIRIFRICTLLQILLGDLNQEDEKIGRYSTQR
jgi:hypothetical protein